MKRIHALPSDFSPRHIAIVDYWHAAASGIVGSYRCYLCRRRRRLPPSAARRRYVVFWCCSQWFDRLADTKVVQGFPAAAFFSRCALSHTNSLRSICILLQQTNGSNSSSNSRAVTKFRICPIMTRSEMWTKPTHISDLL